NALAFEFLTQILVYIYGRLDRVLGRYTTPVGQYVRGNKIQGRDQPFRRESALLGRLRVGCAAGQSLKQIRLVAWLGLSRFLVIGTLPAFFAKLAIDFAGRHRYRAAHLAFDPFDDFGELVGR